MKIRNIFLVGMLVASVGVFAQELRSTYFLEGATYRHQMNPAFMGERAYVAIPALGNLNVGLQGNVGISKFLFRYDDPKYSLTTFLNPSVSADEFLGGLGKTNEMNLSLNMPIISFGFHKWGGFNTFGLNLRTNTNMTFPYELFEFMKVGQLGGQVTKYDFKDLTIRANAYAEIALGHSRSIGENLTVGGKLKFLVGGGNVNAYVEEASIVMSEESWQVNLKGQADVAVNGVSWKTKAVTLEDGNQTLERQKVNGVDFDYNGLNGFGLGIDLGAVYKMDNFIEGLTVSASLVDLGFIRWKKNINAYNDGRKPFSFSGFDNIQVMDKEGDSKDLDDQLSDMGDDLKDLAEDVN